MNSLKNETVVPVSTTPNYKWWVVFMLWFVCFFNYADRQAIFSVFPKLREEFGFDIFQLSLIGSAFAWVYAGAAPLAGFIGDRFRRKDLILGGFFFWSLVTITTGWAQKFWHLIGIRAAEGFGEAFYFPASMSLISDYHDRRTRSRAMSLHQSSVYIGTIGGGALGGLFAEYFGWRMGFYFFGLSGMVLALVLYRYLHEPKRGQAEMEDVQSRETPSPPVRAIHRKAFLSRTASILILVFVGTSFLTMFILNWMPAFRGQVTWMKLMIAGLVAAVFTQLASPIVSPSVRRVLAEIFRTPTAVILMVVFVGANFVAMTFLTWMPTFLGEKFSLKLTMAGLAGTIFIQLASAFGAPLGGVLADRLSRWHPGGRMMVQATGLVLGSTFIFLTGTTRDISALMLWMTIFGFCKGLYDANIFASLYDVVHPRARATAAGVLNAVGWTGAASAPVTIGWILSRGGRENEVANMSNAIAFGCVIYLVAAALLVGAIIFFAKKDVVQKWEA